MIKYNELDSMYSLGMTTMSTNITIAVDKDIYEKFGSALPLNKDEQEIAIEY